MGHGVPTMLGADASAAQATLRSMVPGHMAMGANGMHEMASMRMSVPDTTLPMMGSQGPWVTIGMGGMFTLLEVRDRAVQDPLENDRHDGAGAARPQGPSRCVRPSLPIGTPAPRCTADATRRRQWMQTACLGVLTYACRALQSAYRPRCIRLAWEPARRPGRVAGNQAAARFSSASSALAPGER